jgi:predicted lipid carrier protein YhbT
VGSPPADVTIRAAALDYWLLARREEDPDTLFFARRLLIEGDTALGLTMKNALDAVDWSPASVAAAIAGAAHRLVGRSAREPPRLGGDRDDRPSGPVG